MLSRYVLSQVKHNGYFLAGLALGLWLALATVPLEDAPTCAAPPLPVLDDYEPQREERPDHAAVAAGRAVQRPRYYSTELGMRAPLLAGVLAGAVDARTAAINDTAHVLQPALKFFITADSRQTANSLANVVGFTDSRALLRPFHALKYLADNFLDEYDFFFLSADTAYINARRLKQLVASISVSQDVYMGVVEGDSQYCSLESGILLSNSVLRAVHNSLDWCVRNSYSPHHHENLGRCVLHAARTPCTSSIQGETYVSATLSELNLTPSLADAVTAHPATPPQVYSLHAYVSSVQLSRAKEETRALRRALHRGIRSHPPGFRNGTWPGGLRSEPGLAPPPPDSRFDHPRWVAFNRSHAYMLDDLTAVRALPRAHAEALDMVWETARAWALRQFGAREAALVEGAMRWEPATALRYRLLLRLTGDKDSGQVVRLRQLEVVRPLGAARLVPVPYVTESARLALVLPVLLTEYALQQQLDDAAAFLTRYESVCLNKDKNTNLVIVIVTEGTEPEQASSLRSAATALANRHHANIEVLSATLSSVDDTEIQRAARAGRTALEAGLPRLPRDSLVLLSDVAMEFNEEFLNRARMNSISGVQWFLPSAFARYSTYTHPKVVAPDGSRPQHHTGRFTPRDPVLAVYKQDYLQAESEWRARLGSESASPASILAASRLRALRAPEPGLVLQPSAPPCRYSENRGSCLSKLREAGEFELLELGAKHALAKLELEVKAELE
ncbi:chondroitin sulfate synthase 2 [Leguminivora glycinivorella]|uniref:chondroitin sulfate synthase 2 n=1 Tax=Leguminivora glycinivorella TaxID=1035111 RepID=UPI00200DE2C8|nr:chondroitin sulfate synthase 2 [Leguminivora glycinivorella]